MADRVEVGCIGGCLDSGTSAKAARQKVVLVVALVAAAVVGLIIFFVSLRSVPAAHLGLASTFGHVSPSVLSPGMHVCNPFASVKSFSTKTTLFEQRNSVPTKEGLLVSLDVAVLFRLLPERVYDIYTTLGENFVEVLIAPELASEIRGLTSQGEAKVLYSGGREEIQRNLTLSLSHALSPHGIKLQNVLLRNVELPQQLKDSIEMKAKAEQDAERMKYVLQKEVQEAERKRIEAQGIADFQKIVSEGISAELLQWKGIEVTQKFTQSPNTKLVVVGNSKASLPVLFSGDASKSEV